MSEQNGKVCCNCQHCIRFLTSEGEHSQVGCVCEIDEHYIGYVECMEHWCKQWSNEREVKDGKVRMD